MGTCVIVLGPPRSGTSAVAGMLHKMGCSMGKELMPATHHNPLGFFEDKEFVDAHSRICDGWPAANIEPPIPPEVRQQYEELVRRKIGQPVWGVKDPRLCMLFRLLYDTLTKIGEEVKVVCTVRPFHHSADSLTKLHGGIPTQRAAELIGRYAYSRSKAIEWFLENTPKAEDRLFHITFEEVVEKSENVAAVLAHFVDLSPDLTPALPAAPSPPDHPPPAPQSSPADPDCR